MEQALLVYTTFPDADRALAVGEALVQEKLCACVNVLPGMRSVYSWKGTIERGEEVVAILKTRSGLGDALTAALKTRHSYETPIIFSLVPLHVDPDTMAWITAETSR